MASILPPFPCFIFTVFEPIALVAGYLSPLLDTTGFVNSQLPATSTTTISPTATNRILALQLGNLYGLLAMVGVGVLYTTTEAEVVRNFLLACAIADMGHLYVTYAVMYEISSSIIPLLDRILSLERYIPWEIHVPRLNTKPRVVIQGLHGFYECA